MDDIIIISNLNDFIFCPASIYFHKLYGSQDNLTYQSSYQINGSRAHESVDNSSYSTKKSIITALDVYSDKYKLSGKIDIYDMEKQLLVERKKHISKIYDGYVFQLYAQYYALTEMGYAIFSSRFQRFLHKLRSYFAFLFTVAQKGRYRAAKNIAHP